MNTNKTIEGAFEVVLYAVLLSLPFAVLLNSYIIGVLFIIGIFLRIRGLGPNRIVGIKLLVLTLPYLVYFTGLAFPSYDDEVWRWLEREVAILLFPLIFGVLYQPPKALVIRVGWLLVIYMGLLGAVCILVELNELISLGQPFTNLYNYYHTQDKFISWIPTQTTYLALIISTALCFCLFQINKTSKLQNKLGLALLVIHLLHFNILVGSRIQMFISLFIIVVYYWGYLSIKPLWWKIVGFGTATILVCCLMWQMRMVRYEVRQIFKQEILEAVESSPDGNKRMSRWEVSLDLISENFWFGVGINDHQKILFEGYEEAGLLKAVDKEYNTHNQYLHYQLAFGVFGSLIFLFFLGYHLHIAIRNKNSFYFWAVVIFMMAAITENLFLRQKGVVFISLLFAALAFSSDPRMGVN